jgi:putative flippase GtrA
MLRAIPWQFLRFGLVGAAGFLVDAGLLRLLLIGGLGYYLGRLLSFLAAATTTFVLNRSFTFRREAGTEAGTGAGAGIHPAKQWLAYLALMVVGGAVNYGVYAVAIENAETVRRFPELGVALGSLAGMLVNYWSAKTMIFARRTGP